MTELLIPAVKMPECSWMVFLKNTTPSIARNPCAVCRAAMGHGKCGAVRWGERGWDGQSPLHTSPQLSVNNDSVQVGLYCFWLQAFYRNNCNSCQESFCPAAGGLDTEDIQMNVRWACWEQPWIQNPHPTRSQVARFLSKSCSFSHLKGGDVGVHLGRSIQQPGRAGLRGCETRGRAAA